MLFANHFLSQTKSARKTRIMDIFRTISNTFWSTKVWLPPNVTWADIAPGSRPDVQHADYRDLMWPLPLAAIMILLRYIVEK